MCSVRPKEQLLSVLVDWFAILSVTSSPALMITVIGTVNTQV